MQETNPFMHRIPLYILGLVGILLIGYTVFLSVIVKDHGVVAENDVRLAATPTFSLGTSWVKISSDTPALAGLLDDVDRFGSAVEVIGDLNSDGVVEIAVSAWEDDDGGLNYGATYILSITNTGAVTLLQKISQTSGGFTGPLDTLDDFSTSILALGDLDLDGIPDMALGARTDDDGGTNRGAIYILFMNADGTVKAEQKISDLEGGFTATLDDTDLFGTSMALLPDVNGDGVPDIAVGTQQDDDGGTNRGAIYILHMNRNGTVASHTKISELEGGFNGVLADIDAMGRDLANIGDLDGDGMDDLMVGTLFDDGGADRGGVFVIFLNTDGSVKDTQRISNTAGGFTGTLANADGFGNGITGIGDADGDGINDVVVGNWRADDMGVDSGASFILFMNADGTVKDNVRLGLGTAGLETLLGTDDRFGYRAASHQFNGNGGKDVIITAYNDDDGGTDRGAIYIGYLGLYYTGATTAIVPQFTSVQLENQATCVTSPLITLELRARDAVEVLIGTEPQYLGSDWEPMTQEYLKRIWSLQGEDGEKTIYARFRSETGNQSLDTQVSVLLDTQNNCGVVIDETPIPVPEEGEVIDGEEPVIDTEAELSTIISFGDVIKMPTVTTVYFIDEHLNRRPFEEPFTYFTWFDSYKYVKVVDPHLLVQYPLSSFMTPKAGTVLLKARESRDVYYVAPANGASYQVEKRLIENESVAEQLFGEEWTSFVHDVRPELLAQIPNGENMNERSELVPNVKMISRSTIFSLARNAKILTVSAADSIPESITQTSAGFLRFMLNSAKNLLTR